MSAPVKRSNPRVLDKVRYWPASASTFPFLLAGNVSQCSSVVYSTDKANLKALASALAKMMPK